MTVTSTFLFRFTPSLMEPEALEAVFVQREESVKRILERIRESAQTKSKYHTLLIGPRGIGKTHLVSLVYHRVKTMDDLEERLLIAWMREEEWGITSLLDLLMRIFRALGAEYKDDEFEKRVEALYELPAKDIEKVAGNLLKEYVGNRALLVLIENLDEIFQGLGDEGQKRLRAYIQENPFLTIVATSQSLFSGVSRHSSPFYGFFSVEHLEGLSFEDSVQLLTNIARYRGDQTLASFIQTPMGRARIRAVNHLAGGNHRVYMIFSQFLTRETLDALVEPFMQMLDDLTPYYQDRMRWLSPQQRKIVEFLLNHRSPAIVKDIAQRCFMTHQTASGQLKILRQMRYVQSISMGRESYYELCEPLMRLCVEVKKNRGEPIRLFVDFLRLWYLPDELKQHLELLKPEAIELNTEAENAFNGRFCVLMSLGRWDEGIAALGIALERFAHTDEPATGSTGAIIRNIFNSSRDASVWKTRITTLLELYDKHKVAAALGSGLVWAIPALQSEMVSDAAARAWRDVWQELVGNRNEFKLPLRLLDVAVRYRESKDQRVLLELPIEERKIIEDVLKIEEKTEA